jgi:hypothetical protein
MTDGAIPNDARNSGAKDWGRDSPKVDMKVAPNMPKKITCFLRSMMRAFNEQIRGEATGIKTFPIWVTKVLLHFRARVDQPSINFLFKGYSLKLTKELSINRTTKNPLEHDSYEKL